MQTQQNGRGCLLASGIVVLIASVVCVGLVFFFFAAPSTDALAELKSLPTYPYASSQAFENNKVINNVGVKDWSIGRSDANRQLDSRSASMIFQTQNTFSEVQAFYGDVLQTKGFVVDETGPATIQYIRYTLPLEFQAKVLAFLDPDQPGIFHQVQISARGVPIATNPSVNSTEITVELALFNETGGLK